MAIVVEDGTGVSGANALVSPRDCAAFHLDRGNLLQSYEVTGSCTFTASGSTLALPSGEGSNFAAARIIFVEDASNAGNNGAAWVKSISTDTLTLEWPTLVDETATVTVRLLAASGWWDATRLRLEASIQNATVRLSELAWRGTALAEGQGVPWPRKDVVCSVASHYHRSGEIIASTVVPQSVKDACSSLALEDLTAPLANPIRPGQQFKSKAVGPIAKVYARPTGRTIFPLVETFLRGLYNRQSARVNLRPAGW